MPAEKRISPAVIIIPVALGLAAVAVIGMAAMAKAAGVGVELRLTNITPSDWLWTVQLYDNEGVRRATVANPNPDGSVVKPLDGILQYTVPDDFVYPLKMVLIFQVAPFDIRMTRQSLGAGYAAAGWGLYFPNFVIPEPGSYKIDYVTAAITPV